MSAPTVLIATVKLRAGEEDAFAAWQIRHDQIVARFPGYLSRDVIPPGKPGNNEWTILLNFATAEFMAQWQRSEERAKLIGALLPLVEGGNFGEVMPKESSSPAETVVTQVVLSRIKPGREESYRAWAGMMEQAQAKYPGYRGMYLQPPAAGGAGAWTTLLRYDTQEHLDAWLAAPERTALLHESKGFIENEELMRLATSFPGWVPLDPVTGKGPPNWKTALLVLLGLFPTVMLELKFLSPHLTDLNPALATFLGNLGSVAFTSFVTMPLFIRWFGWWLFTDAKTPTWRGPLGVGLIIVLYLLEIALLWRLLLP